MRMNGPGTFANLDGSRSPARDPDEATVNATLSNVVDFWHKQIVRGHLRDYSAVRPPLSSFALSAHGAR